MKTPRPPEGVIAAVAALRAAFADLHQMHECGQDCPEDCVLGDVSESGYRYHDERNADVREDIERKAESLVDALADWLGEATLVSAGGGGCPVTPGFGVGALWWLVMVSRLLRVWGVWCVGWCGLRVICVMCGGSACLLGSWWVLRCGFWLLSCVLCARWCGAGGGGPLGVARGPRGRWRGRLRAVTASGEAAPGGRWVVWGWLPAGWWCGVVRRRRAHMGAMHHL